MRRELPQFGALVALAFGWHPLPMAVIRPDPAEQLRPQLAGAEWLIKPVQGLVGERGEGAVAAWILGAFVVLWMSFHTVSLAPVELRDDAAEAALWAQHFAFGYKHPPMTAWLFSLWFAIFPRADWAAHLLAVTIAAVTLAVSWRLARDHLDKYRSLFGLAALSFIPLFTFKATEL